jgi:hypothetical protein
MIRTEFIPQIGYGDLRFGMNLPEAKAVIGPEKKITEYKDQFWVVDETAEKLKDIVHVMFPEYGKNNKDIELTFKFGRLVSLHFVGSKGSLTYQGIDLFDKDRKQVLRQLYQHDKDTYHSGGLVFFGALGLVTPPPRLWGPASQGKLRYVDIVDSEYIFADLDYLGLDQLDAIEDCF